MRKVKVEMVRTCDGATHSTETQASSHNEERYTKMLFQVSEELAHKSQKEVAEYIRESLSKFGVLQAIKADMDMEPDEGNTQ